MWATQSHTPHTCISPAQHPIMDKGRVPANIPVTDSSWFWSLLGVNVSANAASLFKENMRPLCRAVRSWSSRCRVCCCSWVSLVTTSSAFRKFSSTWITIGTAPASTTLVRMCSVPRTPRLTTHWKASDHFQRLRKSVGCCWADSIWIRRSRPPSTTSMSRIRGEVEVR